MPEGISAEYKDTIFIVKGEKGSTEKKLVDPKIQISINSNKVIIDCMKASKREKAKSLNRTSGASKDWPTQSKNSTRGITLICATARMTLKLPKSNANSG